MSKYRNKLPQLNGKICITDGGLETTLCFQQNIDLPEFAAFVMLENGEGINTLRDYFRSYIKIALDKEVGFVLESPTWRANPDWATKIGYSLERLDELNQLSITMLSELREAHETSHSPFVISGCVGPRDDGYNPSDYMNAEEAQKYHQRQIGVFSDAGVDMVTAITMTYPEEAIGIVKAAQACNVPAAISFTVETDGRLPNGESLASAVNGVDKETNQGAAYYMVNCAHPSHFHQELRSGEDWVSRVMGIRANASKLSHAELDEAEVLDDGDPEEFAQDYFKLTKVLPHLKVLGGCCGTDQRHIQAFCDAGVISPLIPL